MLETLTIISNEVNKTNITWGIGGSLLLNFHKLIDHPNDIDILVSEQSAHPLNKIISKVARVNEVIDSPPFKTAYFSKYSIKQIDIDIMGGFAIQHEEGTYKLPFNQNSIVSWKRMNGTEIPLCSLEDWYVLYWLIPGKHEKALLIEEHLKVVGIKFPGFLEEALKRPLPTLVRERVEGLLSK